MNLEQFICICFLAKQGHAWLPGVFGVFFSLEKYISLKFQYFFKFLLQRNYESSCRQWDYDYSFQEKQFPSSWDIADKSAHWFIEFLAFKLKTEQD